MNGVEISGGKHALHTDAVINLPTSKSIALRALVMETVGILQSGSGDLPAFGTPQCADIEDMRRALSQIVVAAKDADSTAADPLIIEMGDGAAPFRFIVALAASVVGLHTEIRTSQALARRPLKPLVDALRSIGAQIEYIRRDGYPPLRIYGHRLRGGDVRIEGNISSQFASAMLLASPLWQNPMTLISDMPEAEQVSRPYLDMTLRMMSEHRLHPEPDWSAASYYYALALMRPECQIRIAKLPPASDSMQGDAICEEIFALLGVETCRPYGPDGEAVICGKTDRIALMRSVGIFTTNLAKVPDLVPALAVACCMAGIKFRFEGVAHLRHKESDRLAALHAETEKLGYLLHIDADGDDASLGWSGYTLPRGESECIDTYRDHRIAMAFAMAASRLPYLSIADPQVVDKSYPAFWTHLSTLGFKLRYF